MNNLENLSDEELDGLFRRSAEERDIEFDELAWEKMNVLLDKKKPNNALRNALILLALLFISSIGLYFGNKYLGSTDKKNSEKSTSYTTNIKNEDKKIINKSEKSGLNSKISNEKLKVDNKSTFGEIKATENKNRGKNKQNGLSLLIAEAPQKNKDQIKSIENSKQTRDKLDLKPLDLGSKNSDIATNTKISKKNLNKRNIVQIENNSVSNKVLAIPPNLSNTSKNDILKAENSSNDNTIDNNKQAIKLRPNTNKLAQLHKVKGGNPSNTVNERLKIENGRLIDSKLNGEKLGQILLQEKATGDEKASLNETEFKENDIEKTYLQNIVLANIFTNYTYKYTKPTFNIEIEQLALPIPEAKVNYFFKKGLSIRLLASPDLSTVGKNAIEKIGSDWGALLEYRLGNRLVLNTGIIQSTKKYEAYPEQYKWIWGWSAAKLISVGATCKMLDIPLNIRYDLKYSAKTRMFASTGLTSYIMQKETYNYNYDDNSNPKIKWHQWSGKTGTYQMSNLNISVGFEKQVSKSISLQVEPFVKSPLKSIGFGKVPLITYGMMFSIKYPLSK